MRPEALDHVGGQVNGLRFAVLGIGHKAKRFRQADVVTPHSELLRDAQTAEEQHHAQGPKLGIDPVGRVNDAPCLFEPKPATDDAAAPAFWTPDPEVKPRTFQYRGDGRVDLPVARGGGGLRKERRGGAVYSRLIYLSERPLFEVPKQSREWSPLAAGLHVVDRHA